MKPNWLRGSVWNLLGIGLPFLIALVTMPLLLGGLGPERYGLLLLAWGVVGYFSVFDFGLSRAITQLVAQSYETAPDEAAPVVATGLVVLGFFGALGGLVLGLVAPLIELVGPVPAELRGETVRAVRILGVGLPFVVISTGLRGALEGVFDFAWNNLIRVLTGIATYLGPIAVMRWSLQLDWICAALVLLRAVGALAYLLRCGTYFRILRTHRAIDFRLARTMLGYGGWITVSNLVSPVMAYLDRFLIAGAISVALAGYYSTSQEVLTRFQIVPGAILSVLFPAIARAHTFAPSKAGDIFLKGTQYVTYALLPLAAACLLFAREGLTLWFGSEFGDAAWAVAQVLAVGSFINCLAQNPFTLLQGVGRPDLTAKLHLIELPIYLGALWYCTRELGVVGVAFAWSGRVTLDLLLLLWAAHWAAPAMRPSTRIAAQRMVLPIFALVGLAFVTPMAMRAVVLAVVSLVSAAMLWREWRAGGIDLIGGEA